MDPMDPRRIASTVEQGKKNKRTISLVQNWCRHARIERTGGVGMIEAIHNVPIGHLGVECDHAPIGGMYSWDLEDSFLDYYDRNCSKCLVRQEARRPTIQPIIDQHLKRQAEQRSEADRMAAEHLVELEQRRTERAMLRTTSSVVSVNALDLLDTIDNETEPDAPEKLLELAKLAPRHFDSQVVQYFRDQVFANAPRLAQACFQALQHLHVDEDLLRRLAISHFQHFPRSLEAADRLAASATALSPSELTAILPGIALLAVPGDSPFDRHAPYKGPLTKVVSNCNDRVRQEVEMRLDVGDARSVDLACRIIRIACESDLTFVEPFIRRLLAKLLRYQFLIPEFSEGFPGGLVHLRAAAECALKFNFMAGDKILQALLAGGDRVARKEAGRLYCRFLERRHDDKPIENTPDNKLALRRIIWMAIDDATADVEDSSAISYLSHAHRPLQNLAATQVDPLIGAAMVLTNKLDDVGKATAIKKIETGFEKIAEQNHRAAIRNLQGNLIGLAVLGAKTYEGGVQSLLSLYDEVNVDDAALRANMAAHFGDLIHSPVSLTLVLPYLYKAMTDREPAVRASGLSAVGSTHHEFRRAFPGLVFELYLALMTDTFVIVHSTAVRELHPYDFQDSLKRDLTQTLAHLIQVYARSKDNDHLLVDCLEKYVRGCLTEEQLRGKQGAAVVEIIAGLEKYEAKNALTHSLGTELMLSPGYAKTLIDYMAKHWSYNYQHDDLLTSLRQVPAEALVPVALELQNLALIISDQNLHWVFFVIEVMAKASLWSELQFVLTSILPKIPDTVRDGPIKACYALLSLAVVTEADLPQASQQLISTYETWKKIVSAAPPSGEAQMGLTDYYPLRLQALIGVAKAADPKTTDPKTINGYATKLEEITKAYRDRFPGPVIGAFVVALRLFAILLEWTQAIRAADPNPDRFLRAARLQADDHIIDSASTGWAGIDAFIAMARDITQPSQVNELRDILLGTPLPFAFFPPRQEYRERSDVGQTELPEPLNIAFVAFDINGQPASSINTLVPNQIYDIGLEVRVSRWPETADALVLSPATVEPSGTYDLPTFSFSKPMGEGPFTLRDQGRLILKVPHAIGARPYEFKYSGFFEPNKSEQAVAIVGHRTLRIDGVAPSLQPVTGFTAIDRRLSEVRDALRTLPGVPDDELKAVLEVISALGNLAGSALADNIFPAGTLEGPFQIKCAEWLRRWPTIGENLEQHAHIGGGITDLSFRRVRIELKACSDGSPDDKLLDKFAEQAAQYVVASGLRIGVLCVLDSSPKTEAPPPADSEIQIIMKRSGAKAVALVLLIVQGGLKRPSDLSR